MRTLSPAKIVRAITSQWLALAVTFLTSFVVSPIVVRELGKVGYGVWTLVFGAVAYMGLLDLGLRGAITRYVAKDLASSNHEGSNCTIGAGLWIRAWTAIAILVGSLLLSLSITRFLKIPPEMAASARLAVLLAGTSLGVTILFGVFAGVLAALHRFDVISAVTIFRVLLRGAGFVWLVKSGYGIVALAGWELAVGIASNIVLAALCFRIYPQLRLSLHRPARDTLRSLWQYSYYVFIINLAFQFIYYSDNLVVGAFISVAGVTFYAIGGNLLQYLRDITTALAATFLPLTSSLEAQDQRTQIQRLLINGTRAALFVTLPIILALFLRGRTFIGLWMGEQYAQPSARVLQILLLSQVFAIANATSGNIAYGLGKHDRAARWVSAEAILNVALSIVLARRMGINGVAWGTVIPSLLTNLIFWPRYITTVLGVPLLEYIVQSWIRPMLAAVPYGLACYFTDKQWAPTNLLQFFLQIAAILPLFAVGVAILFWKPIMLNLRHLRPRFSTYKSAA
jgi:O-antigen/teichoic acid export membrane protein